MIVVGIDPHSRLHAAAAVDEQGRLLDGIEVGASPAELARLQAWIESLPQPRLVAIENARGYGLAIVRLLLAQDEDLVDVPATLTSQGRRNSGQRGKTDRGDALVVARVGLRDQDRLPRLDATLLDDELKLLADTRDQLIVEAGRWRNRAHALLRVASPGYQSKTGALASAGSVRRARAIARRSVAEDPVRGRLAVQALDRLAALERDAGRLEREIRELLRIRGCTHLLAIRGVGPIVAATILGETRGIGRFRSSAAFAAHTGTAPVPASSGRTQRHRLNRGGNRQLNRALYTIAMVQARWDPAARAYLDRKLAEGKTAAEARRCLKRHLASAGSTPTPSGDDRPHVAAPGRQGSRGTGRPLGVGERQGHKVGAAAITPIFCSGDHARHNRRLTRRGIAVGNAGHGHERIVPLHYWFAVATSPHILVIARRSE